MSLLQVALKPRQKQRAKSIRICFAASVAFQDVNENLVSSHEFGSFEMRGGQLGNRERRLRASRYAFGRSSWLRLPAFGCVLRLKCCFLCSAAASEGPGTAFRQAGRGKTSASSVTPLRPSPWKPAERPGAQAARRFFGRQPWLVSPVSVGLRECFAAKEERQPESSNLRENEPSPWSCLSSAPHAACVHEDISIHDSLLSDGGL
jgi:hypothetical protein